MGDGIKAPSWLVPLLVRSAGLQLQWIPDCNALLYHFIGENSHHLLRGLHSLSARQFFTFLTVQVYRKSDQVSMVSWSHGVQGFYFDNCACAKWNNRFLDSEGSLCDSLIPTLFLWWQNSIGMRNFINYQIYHEWIASDQAVLLAVFGISAKWLQKNSKTTELFREEMTLDYNRSSETARGRGHGKGETSNQFMGFLHQEG